MQNLHSLKLLKRLKTGEMIKIVDYNKVYKAAFPFLHKLDVQSLPVSVDMLTDSLGIETTPLSQYINAGFDKDEIFQVWGNKDGVVQKSNDRIVIAYNDEQTLQRQRFTIAEECSHILLDHLENKSFSIFDQSYTYEQYQQCEVEARACAGLLLFPPNFYYDYLEHLPVEIIATCCGISLSCAETRVNVYDRYKESICYYMGKYGLKIYDPPNYMNFSNAYFGV